MSGQGLPIGPCPPRNKGDTMGEDGEQEGFGALFWLALGVGFTGLVGFLLTAGAAMGGI
jgi:hypothetical protein